MEEIPKGADFRPSKWPKGARKPLMFMYPVEILKLVWGALRTENGRWRTVEQGFRRACLWYRETPFVKAGRDRPAPQTAAKRPL
jgi:hypothetical protein